MYEGHTSTDHGQPTSRESHQRSIWEIITSVRIIDYSKELSIRRITYFD